MLKFYYRFIYDSVRTSINNLFVRLFYSEKTLKRLVSKNKLHHVAFFADGHRRWGKLRGLSALETNSWGMANVAPKLIRELFQVGVHTVTFWTCSTDNLDKRDYSLRAPYFHFCEQLILRLMPFVREHQIRIVHLGRKDRLTETILNTLNCVEKETAQFTKHVFNIGIDYSGRDEICRAITTHAEEIVNHKKAISQDVFDKLLDTGNQPYPNPDLIIRGANTKRLSGFMSWQMAYSELYFTSRAYLEFDELLLSRAIKDFAQRDRRFGK